jgi:hypothetical protein
MALVARCSLSWLFTKRRNTQTPLEKIAKINLPMSRNFYQLSRVLDDIRHGIPEPLISADRSVHNRIREEFGFHATAPREGGATMYVPFSAFERTNSDLGGTTYATITGIKPTFTEGLIAHAQVFKAGATLLEGCEGQQFLEAGTSLPGAAFSTATDGTTAATDLPPSFTGGTLGTNVMIFSPLRLGVKVVVSKQLFQQGGEQFSRVFRDMLSRAVSGKLDDLALFGSGASGQPLGIYSAVTPVSLGASSMTLANFTGYRSAILATDLDPDSFGMIMSPSFEAYIHSTAFTGGYTTIGDAIQRLVGRERLFIGNEISTTTAMTSGKGFFLGLWRFLYVMIWGSGIEIQYDPISAADTYQMVCRANLLVNIGCTHPSAFAAVWQS